VDSPAVEKLLPAILLGFGGVIPLLIAKPPFAVRESLRPLMAVVFILVVWATYLASYMLFTKWFYSYKITLWLLLGAVIMFFVIYFLLRPAADETNKPGPWMFLLYCAAISVLAAAAANYVGPKDCVVIDLKITDPEKNAVALPISEVGYSIDQEKYYLKITASSDGSSSTLMQSSLFKKLTTLRIELCASPKSAGGKKLKDIYEVDKNRLQLILHPSLTERYSATMNAQYAPEE
jgi:hypothetical protein